MDLVVHCYQLTKGFPGDEKFGLAGQLQRAAVSIPANIAEGQGRQYDKEFPHHLSIAYGSLAEAETHIQIARRLSYIDSETENRVLERTGRIGRMLNGLRESIQDRVNR